MSTLNVNLPNSLHRKLEELSEQEGIAADQFVATAVAEKMSTLLTEKYLEERADRGSREKYERALSLVPDVEPDVEPDERDRIE
jgi:hypothetical protein